MSCTLVFLIPSTFYLKMLVGTQENDLVVYKMLAKAALSYLINSPISAFTIIEVYFLLT